MPIEQIEAHRATVEDASVLGYIHACAWQAAYAGIVPAELLAAFTPEKRAAVFREVLPVGPEAYYLFQADGRPAGFASLHGSHEASAPAGLGEVYAIYFHPDFWGTPVTSWGLHFCVERLQALGYTHAAIWVLEANIRARKFYEKHGFQYDGNSQMLMLGKSLQEIRYSKSIAIQHGQGI